MKDKTITDKRASTKEERYTQIGDFNDTKKESEKSREFNKISLNLSEFSEILSNTGFFTFFPSINSRKAPRA